MNLFIILITFEMHYMINKTMGHIQFEGMEFYAFHGCHKEERIVGGRFLVDLTIETSLEKPAETDNLDDALNYQKAYQVVKEQMAIHSNLLENLAKRILEKLYDSFSGIQKANLKITKMNPPVGGKVEKVSVVMEK